MAVCALLHSAFHQKSNLLGLKLSRLYNTWLVPAIWALPRRRTPSCWVTLSSHSFCTATIKSADLVRLRTKLMKWSAFRRHLTQKYLFSQSWKKSGSEAEKGREKFQSDWGKGWGRACTSWEMGLYKIPSMFNNISLLSQNVLFKDFMAFFLWK